MRDQSPCHSLAVLAYTEICVVGLQIGKINKSAISQISNISSKQELDLDVSSLKELDSFIFV